MRVMIVGTVDTAEPELTTVVRNLSHLVLTLAKHQVHFVIRHTPGSGEAPIPVDALVYQALQTATRDGAIRLSDDFITLVKEGGTPAGFPMALPYTSYTASAPHRIDFYRDLLAITDVVVGIGGRDGLNRMATLCEQLGKPLFLLPGAGGSADILWNEYFHKSSQAQHFTREQLQQLRRNPFITSTDPLYAEKAFDLLMLIHRVLKDHPSRDQILTLDGVDLREFLFAMRRLSLGVWFAVLPIVLSLMSLTYYLGSINVLTRLFGPTSKP